mmetsp:Transcript_1994/g.2176  ORF Transcript_1994/g.2176 Transcript_1994/m.2176 type:complete len:209 (+) Transcript_1994:28-654(+)
MLQYLPGFGSVTAGGSDDGSPINDFAEEPRDAPSPQMRLEAISPRSAAVCSQRARIAGSPARSPQSIRPGSSPVVFDSPASASPSRLLQAERQYWAEITGRQVQELHEALQSKTDACLAAVDKMKQEIMERLRQDISSAHDPPDQQQQRQFGASHSWHRTPATQPHAQYIDKRPRSLCLESFAHQLVLLSGLPRVSRGVHRHEVRFLR